MVFATSTRMVLGALALGSALSMGSPAMAQSETLNTLMGLFGLSPDEEKPEIEYRERAPLVVPPRMELRTPQQSAAAGARLADRPGRREGQEEGHRRPRAGA